MAEQETTAQLCDNAADQIGSEKFVLTLFVAGITPRSLSAIENARQLCDEYLKGRYELEIIDIYQEPALAKNAQVIAAPTLVKSLPLPIQRFIGDLSDRDPILVRLSLKKEIQCLL